MRRGLASGPKGLGGNFHSEGAPVSPDKMCLRVLLGQETQWECTFAADWNVPLMSQEQTSKGHGEKIRGWGSPQHLFSPGSCTSVYYKNKTQNAILLSGRQLSMTISMQTLASKDGILYINGVM